MQADVVFVGQHVVEEARRRHLELEQRRVGVDHGGRFQHLLDVLAPFDLAAELVQRVERIGDVLGGERLAVAPGDPGARLDRQLLVVGAVVVALGEPHDLLSAKAL